jgi:cytochrome c-type biogenesis protein CcmH
MFEFLLALLTAATVGVLLVPLLKTRVHKTERLDNDLAIYRDQLSELEREQAAGALPEAEAKAARLEIERRILVAAEQDQKEAAPRDASALQRILPPVLSLAVPLLALGLYLQLGRPGLPAQPYFARTDRTAPAAAATAGATPADLAKMVAAARAHAAAQPDDADAQSALGEALTMEAQGVVTQPAVDAFTRALKLQPDDPRAAFYLGLHDSQAGDSPAALKRWRALEAQSPADAPWLPTLRAEIQRLDPSAKSVPPATAMPTPSQDQVEAMSKLSPEERQKTIRAMVDGLEAKMRDTPDTSPEARDGWLRLANARKVLGDQAKASEAFARADALKPLDGAPLKDWAETEVRQIPPGGAPGARAVAVLERLERQEPNNALALFYLGAASFAQGDKPAAVKRWKALLGLLPSDAPIRAMLEAKIKEAE